MGISAKWIVAAVALAAVVVAADQQKKDAAVADKTAKLGQSAPGFELKGTDGETHKLSDYADKTVVLEWFNIGCPFVRAAAEMMAKTSQHYADKGVVWLAIDSTHADHRDYRTFEQTKEYLDKHGLKYPVLKDPDGAVGKQYGAKTTPHMFIIHKGELVYAGGHSNVQGVKPGNRNFIAETLDALLAGKDVPNPTTPNRGCSVKYKP